MDGERTEYPHYDGYDPEGPRPDAIYIWGLALVLVADRCFLVDETNQAEIIREIGKLEPGHHVVIRPLSREEAASFAVYLDWDALFMSLPDDHPIGFMREPAMATQELDPSDPRLAPFDFDAIRASDLAMSDQYFARVPSAGDPPTVSDNDLPPLDGP